jgi:HAD superfamily hydrolase (TIGR01548 family)
MEPRSFLVFDMDGVLVDVSRSYRETVRRTARLFLERSRGSEALPDPLFPLEDLAEVKRCGGLNNDWDLTFKIISMLFSKIVRESSARPRAQDPWDAYEEEASRWDVALLADFLSSGAGALQRLYESGPAESVYIGAFYSGDVCDGNVIKQIFQEIYLGGWLFREIYGITPRVYDGGGLIFQERALVSEEVLSRLHSQHMMAVATGRPRSEAKLALGSHGFEPFFDFVLTLDDCLAEESRRAEASGFRPRLSKPDPFMLDAVAARPESRPERLLYVGDMPDDMIAARRSQHNFIPVGVAGSGLGAAAAGESLIEAGARFVIKGIEELEDILKTLP